MGREQKPDDIPQINVVYYAKDAVGHTPERRGFVNWNPTTYSNTDCQTDHGTGTQTMVVCSAKTAIESKKRDLRIRTFRV